jgi:hypothetical protein
VNENKYKTSYEKNPNSYKDFLQRFTLVALVSINCDRRDSKSRLRSHFARKQNIPARNIPKKINVPGISEDNRFPSFHLHSISLQIL